MLAPRPGSESRRAAPPSSALIPCSSAWRFGLLLREYIEPARSRCPRRLAQKLLKDESATKPRPWPDQRCGRHGQLKSQFSSCLACRGHATGCKCGCRLYGVAAFGIDSRRPHRSELTAPIARRKYQLHRLPPRSSLPSLFNEYLRRRSVSNGV